MEIIWLDQLQAQDQSLVGGKAANLSRLIAEYPVPPGFCLPVPLFSTIGSENSDVDIFSKEINALLTAAYHNLEKKCRASNLKVAVRSSAIGEDGLTDSFAGQYMTHLNVVGADAVIEAINHCWKEAHNIQVQTYRHQRRLSDEVQLSILVQQLIMADISAVVFSHNPVTGNKDEIMINASWGLGESIVGGTVTPDNFVVDKSTLTVTQYKVVEKQSMTVIAGKGTREVRVPRLMSQRPSITTDQAIEMARLALELESKMGWPVDIECAYQDEVLYLLQCRPITVK